MNLGTEAKAVAQLVTDAGVPAVLDERDLVIPGALVGPSLIDLGRLDGTTAEVTWEVWLVAPDNGPMHALTTLGEMFDKVRGPLGVTEARPMSLTLPNHGADPMPALQITVTLQHDED